MSRLDCRDPGAVPRRTLEVDFPAPLNSDEVITLPGPLNAPIIKQAVRWKTTPMGRDAQSQVWYTGLSNGNNREAYNRWYDWYKRRELKSVPHAYAQHLREACFYDPTVPAQYLHPGTRWGPFEWNDRPIPRKEFVVNRHTFGTRPGQTEECLHPYIEKFC
ncbi:tektin bundle-interacting protein 1 [Lissotriton helveticus]